MKFSQKASGTRTSDLSTTFDQQQPEFLYFSCRAFTLIAGELQKLALKNSSLIATRIPIVTSNFLR